MATAEVTGLLIRGELHQLADVHVIAPASHGGPSWAYLSPGDYTVRRTQWVRQVIIHTTGGLWPQRIIDMPGNGGECVKYADIWQSDPTHSAAHLVVDSAGTVVCLADLGEISAYHAEASNDWSVGIEMAQARDGSLHQATLDATALLVQHICSLMMIPEQMPRGPYSGAPLARMERSDLANGRHQIGGQTCVGVFGHRDNTSTRGRGDPGDAIWSSLAALGFEGLDYAGGEDLAIGKARQRRLGNGLAQDGLVGPASIAESRKQGYVRWRDVPAD